PLGQCHQRCDDLSCQEVRHHHPPSHTYYTQREHPPTCLGDLHLHLMQGQSHPYCAPFLCAAWYEHWHSNIIILSCSPRARHTLDESRPGLYGLLAHKI